EIIPKLYGKENKNKENINKENKNKENKNKENKNKENKNKKNKNKRNENRENKNKYYELDIPFFEFLEIPPSLHNSLEVFIPVTQLILQDSKLRAKEIRYECIYIHKIYK
ncbi:10407_t:CDS:2, partial [Dentiscutata erythropus]